MAQHELERAAGVRSEALGTRILFPLGFVFGTLEDSAHLCFTFMLLLSLLGRNIRGTTKRIFAGEKSASLQELSLCPWRNRPRLGEGVEEHDIIPCLLTFGLCEQLKTTSETVKTHRTARAEVGTCFYARTLRTFDGVDCGLWSESEQSQVMRGQ